MPRYPRLTIVVVVCIASCSDPLPALDDGGPTTQDVITARDLPIDAKVPPRTPDATPTKDRDGDVHPSSEGGLPQDGAPPDLSADQKLAADSTPPDSGTFCVHPIVQPNCKDGWCVIPAGCFRMGSPSSEACREEGTFPPKETQHKVTLTRAFVIAQTETTREQFQSAMGYDPSTTACTTNCPVTNVTWHESAAYCNALSTKLGLALCYSCSGSGATVKCSSNVNFKTIYDCSGYRLPTEAEWEYAYRAGTQTAYYNGKSDTATCNGVDAVASAIGWYDKNAGSTDPHPVMGKLANGWSLYDMAGNVFEWCDDSFVNDLTSKDVVDPWIPPGVNVTVRGGAVATQARKLRASYRAASLPSLKATIQGFRCVASP
jgi:formylglycine-generating enzyme required for sulfatase activity